MSERSIEITADIVASYVHANEIGLDELPLLIRTVYATFENLGQPTLDEAVVEQKPAVSIRTSVKPDSVACLECGKKMKMLKRHLTTDHGLGVDAYRAKWNLPKEYPLVAPNYAEQRKQLAVKIGLGRGAVGRKRRVK